MADDTTFPAILSRIAAFLAALWASIVSALPGAWDWIGHQWSTLGERLDEWFPPESRPTSLQICLWVLAAALFLCCCGSPLLACIRGIFSLVVGCVLGVFRFLGRCFCCCGRYGAGKMMKAPGRDGERMVRASFEADPRGYFRDLRGGKPLGFSDRGPLLC